MSKTSKISDLTFDPNNARVRTAKGEAMIQESLQQVGAARSIVIDENGVILAGNGTVEAAGQIGIDRVKIIEASGNEIIAVRRSGLTDEQKKKLAYYDNRTGDEAQWDMEQVAADLLGGYDFLDELFDDIEIPAPEQQGGDELPEDPAEVLREKWGVEYGDLWQIGEHRILCGDSTKKEDVDRLMDGEKADMLFTDPPYGVSFVGIKASMYQGGKKKGKDSNQQIKGDELRGEDITEVFNRSVTNACLFTKQNAPFYIFFGINRSEETIKGVKDAGLEIRNWLIWDKGNVGFHAMGAQYKPNYESFLYCFKKENPPEWKGNQQQQTIWRHSVERLGLHPTMKPVTLISQAVGNHSVTLLLDLFLGSGSTMVAAHNENRICYAMEIDPAYVAVCLERMSILGYDPVKVEKLEA